MSGISLGQAIGIIGGVPILKNVRGHTVDHLKIPRHIAIGTAGTAGTQQNLLSSVLSGGIGSLLQSPLGSALTPLMSAITGAVASLNAASSSSTSSGSTSSGTSGSSSDTGGGDSTTTYMPLVTALNTLSTSATNLSTLADNLVGYASNTALPTQMDVIGHMSATQSLGGTVPTAVSLATVLAPVQSSTLLLNALSSVQSIVAQVLADTMTVADAVTAAEALQAGLDAVTTASTGAVSAVQAAQPFLCAAQSAIALLVGGTSDMIEAMMVAIRPDMLATVQNIVEAHNEAVAVSAASQAAASAALASIAQAQAAAEAQYPAT